MNELRIGDVEREQAVSALGEHYLAGRLTKEEYDERASVAWAARTTAALQPLFRDLPHVQKPVPKPVAPQRGRSRRGRRFPVFPFVLLFIFVMVATPLHLPWWGWMIFLWMWFSGMFAGMSRHFSHRCRQA